MFHRLSSRVPVPNTHKGVPSISIEKQTLYLRLPAETKLAEHISSRQTSEMRIDRVSNILWCLKQPPCRSWSRGPSKCYVMQVSRAWSFSKSDSSRLTYGAAAELSYGNFHYLQYSYLNHRNDEVGTQRMADGNSSNQVNVAALRWRLTWICSWHEGLLLFG